MNPSTWLEHPEEWLAALGVLSVALFLISLVVFPLIAIHLPADHFARPERTLFSPNPIRFAGRVLKNAFGVLLVFAGILMLFLPGQGILSIVLGISLVDFPRKRTLQLRLIRLGGVRRSIDWIRRKAGREPLVLPEPGHPAADRGSEDGHARM